MLKHFFYPTVFSTYLLVLAGCSTLGPIESPNFDAAFSRTLEAEEQLIYFAKCDANADTYMENEIVSTLVYTGVLLLSNKRLIFTQWSKKEQRYIPLAWIQYADIKNLKKKNTPLIQYVAVRGVDESKNAYFMTEQDVDQVYEILRDQIKKSYKHDGEKQRRM